MSDQKDLISSAATKAMLEEAQAKLRAHASGQNAEQSKQAAAALEAQKLATFNPANPDGVAASAPKLARRRIPLSVPRRKLEATPIPGYVLYWFKESNTEIAIQAGYDFVDAEEVTINQTNEAGSSEASGNTDLGSRVSVIGDRVGERGVPERLILMKIPEDWWREDRELLDNENAAIIKTIFGGGIFAAERGDHSQSYVKTSIAHGRGALFNRGLKKVT